MDRKAGFEQYRIFMGGLGSAGQRARIPASLQLARNLRAARMGGLALKLAEVLYFGWEGEALRRTFAELGLIVRALEDARPC